MAAGLKLFASDAYVVGIIRLWDNISYFQIFIFSVVNSLMVPFVALILAAFAKNKIEGFAFVKGGGILLMIPVLAIINAFQGRLQYVLGIAPNFWPVKAMLNAALQSQNAADLNYYAYMGIGAVYSVLIGIGSLRFFLKKSAKA
jgi:fluoroquinolone transport system permease protein